MKAGYFQRTGVPCATAITWTIPRNSYQRDEGEAREPLAKPFPGRVRAVRSFERTIARAVSPVRYGIILGRDSLTTCGRAADHHQSDERDGSRVRTAADDRSCRGPVRR